MNPPPLVIVGIPMAGAIVVFFWSLDRIRKERIARPLVVAAPRATPRELVERLLRPAADNLSQRRSASGKPTLTEDLARAGLNVTPAEYVLVRVGAVGFGVLGGLLRFGMSIGAIMLGAVGFVAPPLVMAYLQGRRERRFNGKVAGRLQLLS